MKKTNLLFLTAALSFSSLSAHAQVADPNLVIREPSPEVMSWAIDNDKENVKTESQCHELIERQRRITAGVQAEVDRLDALSKSDPTLMTLHLETKLKMETDPTWGLYAEQNRLRSDIRLHNEITNAIENHYKDARKAAPPAPVVPTPPTGAELIE
jgi:hypothetical protein